MILTVTPNTTLDHVYVVDRLARAARLPATEQVECIGGKGGLLSAFAVDFGARSVALGFAAGENGRRLAQLLRRRGVRPDFTPAPGETRRVITIVEEAKVGETLLLPVSIRCSRPSELDLLRRAERWLPKSSWLALCGSLAPGCSPALYARLTRLAGRRRVPVLVDSRGPALSRALAARPAVVKLNLVELEQTVGERLRTRSALLRALRSLVARGVELAVCTLGSGGALAVTAEAAWRLVPPPIKVRSATGAGDAFAAGLLAFREKGLVWPQALRWAVAAGAAKARETRTDGLDPEAAGKIFRRVRVTAVSVQD